LFFAKGLIIVEGWSEEIIIPALAKKLGFDLTKKEVSVINVASTAYLHFAKIFLRNDEKSMNIPVAIVTDLDNRPDINGNYKPTSELDTTTDIRTKTKYDTLENLKQELKGTSVVLEWAKEWTLEWCLYKSSSLSELFKESVSEVHSETVEFKKDKNTGNFNDEFKKILISKLKKDRGTSKLDKVKVASLLAEKINASNNLVIDHNDDYIKYLINAIKHACSHGI